MTKYEPLTHFLSANRTEEIPMTFREIEEVVGFKLPTKASGIRAWWSNNPSNNVMTKAWLAAGYVTERVDMGGRRLVFRRAPGRVQPSGPRSPGRPNRSIGFLDRIRAELGGTVTIPEGVDITAPTGEVWDAER
jgi:hypothetical protein